MFYLGKIVARANLPMIYMFTAYSNEMIIFSYDYVMKLLGLLQFVGPTMVVEGQENFQHDWIPASADRVEPSLNTE